MDAENMENVVQSEDVGSPGTPIDVSGTESATDVDVDGEGNPINLDEAEAEAMEEEAEEVIAQGDYSDDVAAMISNAAEGTPDNGVSDDQDPAEDVEPEDSEDAPEDSNDAADQEDPSDSAESHSEEPESAETTDAPVSEEKSDTATAESEPRRVVRRGRRAAGAAKSDTSDDAATEEPAVRATTRRRSSRRAATPDTSNTGEILATAPVENVPVRELRKAAREAAAESGSAISQDSMRARSHGEVLRMSREREAARNKAREELVKIHTAWSGIIDAERRHTIIEGEVIGVEEVNGTVIAVLDVQGFRTVIPFKLFYLSDPIDYANVRSEREARLRQAQMLTQTLGLRTPFVIINHAGADDLAKAVVLGSRAAALEVLNNNFFTGPNRVREGDTVEGTVSSVSTHTIRVLVGGIDVRIPKALASLRYIDVMSNYFELNDRVNVTIRSFTHDKKGNLDIVADMLDEDRLEMSRNLYRVREGGRYLAQITRVTRREDGTLRYRLHFPNQDIVGFAPGTPQRMSNQPVQTGDKVIALVTYINNEYGNISTRIIRVVDAKRIDRGQGVGLVASYSTRPHIIRGGEES